MQAPGTDFCLPADSPDFKPRVNWSRFHETMPLAEMAQDPYAKSASALKTNVPGMTSTDGVNGPADISGGPASPDLRPAAQLITTFAAAGWICSDAEEQPARFCPRICGMQALPGDSCLQY